MKIALVQLISAENYLVNLAKVESSLIAAVSNQARMVVLPEFFIQISEAIDKFAIAEEFGCGKIQAQLSAWAKQYQIYLVAGTIPLKSSSSDNKFKNTCLVFAPSGAVIARYDKLHLFRLNEVNETYNETVYFDSGDEVVTFNIDEFSFGLAICYDLRFPELFRTMNVDAIILPSAFTKTTGEAHWEILCRSRAIENQCYMLAVNQGGDHPSGRQTYGHSMAIDPWGKIIANCTTGEHILYVEIDKSILSRYRNKLPALQHRVLK